MFTLIGLIEKLSLVTGSEEEEWLQNQMDKQLSDHPYD